MGSSYINSQCVPLGLLIPELCFLITEMGAVSYLLTKHYEVMYILSNFKACI